MLLTTIFWYSFARFFPRLGFAFASPFSSHIFAHRKNAIESDGGACPPSSRRDWKPVARANFAKGNNRSGRMARRRCRLKSDRFLRSKNRAWSVRIWFRKRPDLCRAFARSRFYGEQNHGRKEVNQKAKPFERGKTQQSFVEENLLQGKQPGFPFRQRGRNARRRCRLVPSSPAKIP